MFGSSDRTLYEGIWKIEDVRPINEKTVLITFKTGFFTSKEAAEDPLDRQIEDYGPVGKSIQSVTIGIENVPTVEDYNNGNRRQIYETLTEELEFETRTDE